MGSQRIMIIIFGTMAMFLLMYFRRKNYPRVKVWKMAVISVLLTFAGVAGAMLMHYIENGSFGGTSFFGSILFVPILILPALLTKVKYGTIMDLCAASESLMLAFMKFDCLLSNCCIGRYLPSLGFQFPSQIVEIIVTLIIVAILMKIEKNPDNKNTLYGWYLILYGSTRFVLNWFRYGVKPFVWILPAGNFWSIIAVITGVLWVQAVKYRKRNAK